MLFPEARNFTLIA